MKSFVFITGAAGGLGRAFVKHCSIHGWNLFLTDIPGSAVQELAEKTRSEYNIEVRCMEGDFLTHESRDQFFSKLKVLDIQFHMLINIAGVEFEMKFFDQSLHNIRTIMNVNMNGTIETTYTIFQKRDPAQKFVIITVSSLAYNYPMPFKALYSASKRFLHHFFHALREELHDQNASITVLSPAGMPTKQAVIDRINKQGFMGRLTTRHPDYVAMHTLKKAQRGVPLYIPGWINRLLRQLSFFMSDLARAKFIRKRWDQANSTTKK